MQLDPQEVPIKLANWPCGLGQWGKRHKAQRPSLDPLFPPHF